MSDDLGGRGGFELIKGGHEFSERSDFLVDTFSDGVRELSGFGSAKADFENGFRPATGTDVAKHILGVCSDTMSFLFILRYVILCETAEDLKIFKRIFSLPFSPDQTEHTRSALQFSSWLLNLVSTTTLRSIVSTYEYLDPLGWKQCLAA